MMHSVPDGGEVVATRGDADALPSPPLLLLEPVADFLDKHGIGQGPLAWKRIGDGHSNITYLIRRGTQDVVLRRGPRPPLPKSTHDMVREARIQQLLRPHGVPVPRIIAVCDDESVLGVPFYLMEALDGIVITDTVPPDLDTPDQREATSEALVDVLVDLHDVDVTAGELATFGRPEGYLQRQVERFASLWKVNTTRDLPQVNELADWLGSNLPPSQTQSVVHGDYRMGNLMFARDAPARVIGILDWEMATLGDPLADLGYLTATYADEHSTATPLELSPVTRRPGFLTTHQIVDRYRTRTHLDLTPLPWYQTLALWKAGIFSEAIYARWLNGESPHDTTFAPSLKEGVPALLRKAQEYSRSL
ncbi:MAG: phosphotransferase [Propionibacteriales bacterium]|nr:phosphotransferase [Propionibacteriales bacterium]